jgi:hypothetical protein
VAATIPLQLRDYKEIFNLRKYNETNEKPWQHPRPMALRIFAAFIRAAISAKTIIIKDREDQCTVFFVYAIRLFAHIWCAVAACMQKLHIKTIEKQLMFFWLFLPDV